MAQTIRITSAIGIVAISGNTLLALSMDCNNVAATTAASPTWRPAERSVPWVTINPATPSAIIIRTDDWVRILLKFNRLKNVGSWKIIIASKTKRTT